MSTVFGPVPAKLDPPKDVYYCSESSIQLHKNHTHIIGFGFDGTACFRKGTKYGPDALRSVSDGIESYSPYQDADTENIKFYDLGNLFVDERIAVEDQWQKASDAFEETFTVKALRAGVRSLTIGGEHSISYAPLKQHLKAYPDLVVIHLDAHADLRDGYEGYHYSHASIIRRALDHFGPNHKLIQYGIRSGTKEEYSYMLEQGTLAENRGNFLERVRKIATDRPIYLTLDLDYFDPAIFPGTGTPEPGGEDFHSFISLIKIINTKKLIGADVVELSPPIDKTGNSEVFAAKVVRELILVLDK